jgi:hypothetical protein
VALSPIIILAASVLRTRLRLAQIVMQEAALLSHEASERLA